MPDKKTISVTYEYDDGSKAIIEGKYLEMWEKAVDGLCSLAHVHGMLPEETFKEVWDNVRIEEK